MAPVKIQLFLTRFVCLSDAKLHYFLSHLSLTCDINQFSNGVADSQGTKLCSAHISDPYTKTRDRSEPHPVVLRGGGGYSSSSGTGPGGGFIVQFDCGLLSVERPPGGLGGGFPPVLVSFNLVESEAVVEIFCSFSICYIYQSGALSLVEIIKILCSDWL